MTKDHGGSLRGKDSSGESPLTRRQLLQAAVGVGGGLLASGLTGCADGPQRLPGVRSTGMGGAASMPGTGVAGSTANASGVEHFYPARGATIRARVPQYETPRRLCEQYPQWKTASAQPIL